MGSGRGWLIASLVLGFGAAAAAAPAPAPAPGMLPARVFTCDVGHVTNFDSTKRQSPADLQFDTRHKLVFALPAGPARTTLPPDVNEEPEKVSPGSQILSDPDHIVPQHQAQFDQVVDYWPERVELMGMIKTELRNAIVLDSYDAAAGTVNLFMLRASELTQYDKAHIYQGSCRVTLRAPARGALARRSPVRRRR